MARLFTALFLVCFGISVAAAQNVSVSPIRVTAQAELAPNPVASHASAASSSRFSDFIWKLVLIVVVLLTITGIAYGITDRAVFYMDRNDMIYSCTPYIAIIVGGFLTMLTEWNFLFWIGFIIALVLFISIIQKSFQYNGTKLLSIPTAVAKLVLSFLVVVQIMSAISPSGANNSKRRYNRNSALVFLMFLLPLVYILINGNKVLAAREDAASALAPVNQPE